MASGSADNTIKLWDVDLDNFDTIPEIDTNSRQTLTGHKEAVVNLNFSPDGERIVSASYDNTIKLWKIENNGVLTELLKTIKAPEGGVTGAIFIQPGQAIASVGGDGQLKIWNLDGQLLKNLRAHTDTISRVAFFEGKLPMLATASQDKSYKKVVITIPSSALNYHKIYSNLNVQSLYSVKLYWQVFYRLIIV